MHLELADGEKFTFDVGTALSEDNLIVLSFRYGQVQMPNGAIAKPTIKFHIAGNNINMNIADNPVSWTSTGMSLGAIFGQYVSIPQHPYLSLYTFIKFSKQIESELKNTDNVISTCFLYSSSIYLLFTVFIFQNYAYSYTVQNDNSASIYVDLARISERTQAKDQLSYMSFI